MEDFVAYFLSLCYMPTLTWSCGLLSVAIHTRGTPRAGHASHHLLLAFDTPRCRCSLDRSVEQVQMHIVIFLPVQC